MSLEALEADLAQTDVATDPDRWALAAYRLAVARSELATHPDQLNHALGLLDKAARILTPERAPIEHARIITAAANAQRALGATNPARSLFEQAAELLAGRVPPDEEAAALINVGLARTESGRSDDAIAVLDEAVSLASTSADEQSQRLLGAALINRAQAHQALGTDRGLASALADYEHALAALDADSPQAGMAAHGRGTAILERVRRRGSSDDVDDAIVAFLQSLTVLSPSTYPFQHAIARHSLALAYERRNGPHDRARALDSAEASLAIFDPRLHRPHWETATATLARLEEAAGHGSRMEHIVGLLATTSEAERTQLLRDRLRRLAALPTVRLDRELDALTTGLTGLPRDRYRVVVRSLLSVLMELPDRVLEGACASLCRAHRASAAPDQGPRPLDRALDEIIHELLFGPQRVRVRDLLAANGWVRP